VGDNRYRLSTLTLLGFLLAILAWELEIGVVLLHFFVRKPLNPLGHAALLGFLLALTVFSYVRGRRDFALVIQSIQSRERVPVTGR
jgi:hypothetical protein